MNTHIALAAALFLLFAANGWSADLVLAADAKSDYQIVVPETPPTPAIGECLGQTARLIQTAFKANGFDGPVVSEGKRDPAKPAIYLGNTAFARANGVDVAALRDWSYVQRVVGKDVIIAGHDHPAKAETTSKRRPNWDRLGTAKATADFVRQFMGVRFLYPEIAPYNAVSAAAKIDLLASPAIEFLPMKTIAVPADLNVRKTPVLRLNTAHPAGGGFYDLAHNRFPRVDEMFASHTWERAVPPEKYAATHPEYFALVSGARLKPENDKAQYCLSNPDVQELIYRDLASWLDRGYASVDLGQPDGFRECQCENCSKLFGTGKDWSEKIWIFNRNVAERLQRSHPGRQVTMMSYILTAAPPKTFKKFPSNTCIMLTGTNEEDIAPWRDIEVPRGFTGYVYNWCPNLGSRYTPMRTPGFVEAQAKRLAANRIQAIYRDGPGQLFGLEGPVYYVMGRMFDDPERNSAKDLLPEFCDAAFGRAAGAMRSFYDQLYHAIALYSNHIGTRCNAWTYNSIEGRRRKTVTDPFQLIAFLYPPVLLASLDADLTQAEKLAATAKTRTRLALVRTEFEYLRYLARVVHLHHAYQVQPDAGSRDRLLDAIDARNAFIASLYTKRGKAASPGDWSYVLFPFGGHDANHLRLAHDGYQEPYASTCLNWDTKAMRNAPVPGKKRLTVARAQAPVTLNAPQWQQTASHELTLLPPFNKQPRKTSLRLLHDATNLYIRAECELAPDAPAKFPTLKRDSDLRTQESLDLYFAPQPARGIFYRFMVGANPASRYDAANGFITDAMDPRHGKDDPTWNGDWQAESRVDTATHRWHALVTIPFKTFAVESPAAGAVWRGNFARCHRLPREKVDRAIWSSTAGNQNMNDHDLFGEIVFADR
ncbi:MAG: DUF4838 domain-containing protein [Verrucomicrobia bacterium]|nr:DUF4838 domain-containing protein [Verrucomicrobiota bacterium]